MEPQDKNIDNKSNIIPKKMKYTILQKIKAVNEANKYSIHFVADKYNIDRASIRDWKKQFEQLQKIPNKNYHRIPGGGAKSISENKENDIINWIIYHRKLGLALSTKAIIGYAVSIIPEFKEKNFKSLLKWCYRFMNRHNLTMRLAGHIGQPLPKNIIDQFYEFFHYCIIARQKLNIDDNNYNLIVNMDETAVYLEMPEKKRLN